MNISDRILKTIKKIAKDKNRPEDEVSWKEIAVEQAIELNDLFALRGVVKPLTEKKEKKLFSDAYIKDLEKYFGGDPSDG